MKRRKQMNWSMVTATWAACLLVVGWVGRGSSQNYVNVMAAAEISPAFCGSATAAFRGFGGNHRAVVRTANLGSVKETGSHFRVLWPRVSGTGGSGGGGGRYPTVRFVSPPGDDESKKRIFSRGAAMAVFASILIAVVAGSLPYMTSTPQEYEAPGKHEKRNNKITKSAAFVISSMKGNWAKLLHRLNPFKQKITTVPGDILALQNTMVTSAVAPNSTLLPTSVVSIAATRSKLIGSKFQSSTVRECARLIQQYYNRKGYILSSVTGATLSDDGSVVLSTEEPIIGSDPIELAFAKRMVVTPDNERVTLRQYRSLFPSKDAVDISRLNTTYVKTEGRLSPKSIGDALGLKPGSKFKWDENRFIKIKGSRIIKSVLYAAPVRKENGTVQLHMVVQENPLRSLEYGLSKSLYTGHWEGELELEHLNIFGGGEVGALCFKRGAGDEVPSFAARYSDDLLGSTNRGFDLEIFQEYIAVQKNRQGEDQQADMITPIDETVSREIRVINPLIMRKGISVRIRQNPFIPIMKSFHSAANVGGWCSAVLERVSTRTGQFETIGSTTVEVGPIFKGLPRNARHSLLATMTSGGRSVSNPLGGYQDSRSGETIGEKDHFRGGDSLSPSTPLILPYSHLSVVAREVFPLVEPAVQGGRSFALALRHVLSLSTKHLPRHVANAAGFAASIRGYSTKSNGPLRQSLHGTAEARIPVTLPSDHVLQDASFVLFFDWLFGGRIAGPFEHAVVAKEHIHFGDYFRKSSIGIGIRKSVQGIPIKCDFSLTEDGRLGTVFNIGGDFDVY